MEKEENTNTEEIKSEKLELNEEKKEESRLSEKNENKDSNENVENTPEEKILELEDKLARTFAEMENQRRRFEKEKEEAYEYGGVAFAREALNLIDNLERSKDILKNDEALKNTDSLSKTLDHLEIIYNDLISIFSKNNIKPIESLNKRLDPNFHQAMMEIEDDQKEPGTIIKEIQKGFTIKDRLLRPSLVGVSKKSQKNDEKEGENQEKNQNK